MPMPAFFTHVLSSTTVRSASTTDVTNQYLAYETSNGEYVVSKEQMMICADITPEQSKQFWIDRSLATLTTDGPVDATQRYGRNSRAVVKHNSSRTLDTLEGIQVAEAANALRAMVDHFPPEAKTTTHEPAGRFGRSGYFPDVDEWFDAPGLYDDATGITSIPFAIDDAYGPDEVAWLLRAMQHLGDRIGCIEWVPRQYNHAYWTQFIRTPYPGCYAYVGAGSPTQIHLTTPGCMMTYTIMHELLHTLGFHHTHQRPDGDDHINYFPERASAAGRPNISPCYDCPLPDWDFDCRSVMMYNTDAFATSDLPVLEAKDPDQCFLSTGLERVLEYGYDLVDYKPLEEQISAQDIAAVQDVYCNRNIPGVPANTTTLRPTTGTGPPPPTTTVPTTEEIPTTTVPTTEEIPTTTTTTIVLPSPSTTPTATTLRPTTGTGPPPPTTTVPTTEEIPTTTVTRPKWFWFAWP